MTEDFDEIADDASQWGEPIEIAPTPTVDTVLSVRLSLEQADQIRTLARSQGVKVGTLLRQLIARGLGQNLEIPNLQGVSIATPLSNSVTLFFDGSTRQMVSSELWGQWSGELSPGDNDWDPALPERTG